MVHRGRTSALPTPGDAVLAPPALVALALLALNDHVLKASAPGVLTGKLSDFAGLAFFPLFLVGLWEVTVARARGRFRPTTTALVTAVAATAVAFVAVELIPAADALYERSLGLLQWLPTAFVATLARQDPAPAVVVVATPDPSDLVALLALVLPWRLGRARVGTAVARR